MKCEMDGSAEMGEGVEILGLERSRSMSDVLAEILFLFMCFPASKHGTLSLYDNVF